MPWPNNRNSLTQHIATLLDTTCCTSLANCYMLGIVGQTHFQHVTTKSDNFEIRCIEMLQSFGQGLSCPKTQHQPGGSLRAGHGEN